MPPSGGTRTSLASYTWGQQGLEAHFRDVFQPGHGIFSPGYPLAPSEPERTRLWDFPVGVNTVYTPRAYEPISFAELRALADGHDITRLAIETRKDQLEKLDWTVKPRAARRTNASADPDAATRADCLARFWRRPDGERPFATWLRDLVEDLLVLDAPALEVRRNRGGDIIGLDVVDGATLKLLFDDTGRRPRPPAPAFEQVIHGRPWKLLTSDELLYLPRNKRPHKAYGFGPVEQIVMTINIALRRQIMQLQHFTDGNVPPGLLNAPDGWNAEQIRQFQEWFDSVLAGNTGGRSRLVWGPSGTHYQAFKEAPYKDEFDEWLARIVCYAFSLPPTPFVRQLNRATADTAQEAALAEGLAPLMGWVKRLADQVIQDLMGQGDLEFAWLDRRAADPAEQAKLIDTYVRAGVYTLNEARDALGLDPVPGGDTPRVYSTAGPVPLTALTLPAAATKPSPASRERGDRPPRRAVGEGAAAVQRSVPTLLAKDGYDPDEPRVPTGNPDGGQWTTGGDGGSDAGNAPPPGSGGSQPPTTDNDRVWERFPNPDFRNSLAVAEGSADKPNYGYGDINRQSGALGRYQMLTSALQAAGMLDADGNWTGKYGIHSAPEFLASPEAQEKALTDYLNDIERQLRANGAFDYLGIVINGRVASFTITAAGLVAAGHRDGAPRTRDYLDDAASDGFTTQGRELSRRYLEIETRLRTFANVPYN